MFYDHSFDTRDRCQACEINKLGGLYREITAHFKVKPFFLFSENNYCSELVVRQVDYVSLQVNL